MLVAAAVIKQAEGYWMVRRGPGRSHAGMWEFPGGKVENGESHQQALIREINEEMGCSIEVDESLGIYRHAYTHFRVTLHAYHCRVISGEPQALDASEIRWVKVNELTDYPMGKIDRLISNDLQK